MRECNVLAGVPQLAGQRQPHHRLNIFWKGKKRVMRHETSGSAALRVGRGVYANGGFEYEGPLVRELPREAVFASSIPAD